MGDFVNKIILHTTQQLSSHTSRNLIKDYSLKFSVKINDSHHIENDIYRTPTLNNRFISKDSFHPLIHNKYIFHSMVSRC